MTLARIAQSLLALALLVVAGAACSNRDSAATASKTESTTAAPNRVTPASSGDPVLEPVEQLFAVPPRGWTLSSSSNRESFRRARYLRDPTATHLESLTFEYMDPQDLLDPIDFLGSMAAEQNDRCESFSSVAIASGIENGYPSAVRLLRCPKRKVNRRSTVTMAKAIAGNDGYYLIVFEKATNASLGEDGWRTDHVSEDDVARWSLYLRQAQVCDPRTTEHPCPAPVADSPQGN